ncbi:MAG: FHA domain-containing protein [Chloroflexi bacterium]|nr:FHA domain-containing protein [Chloroflexota bacterium]
MDSLSGPVLLVLRALLALSLYAFLGWALTGVWRDLRRQAAQSAARLPALLILEGAAPGLPRASFSAAVVTLGRDPSCDYVIEDATVSARHARLFYRSGQWWVEDLHSTNGAFINEERLTAPLAAAHGDVLRCGQAALKISIEKPA